MPHEDPAHPETATPDSTVAKNETPSPMAIAPEVLKSAYNSFKKRWKLTRLDQESRIGRSPLSSGQKSTIAGIVPPDQFPQTIWDELVRQGKIKPAGKGFYSMP